MNNEIQIFNNPEFGKIRTVAVNNEPHFVASDVAKALGYEKPNNAVNQHCRYARKQGIPHPQSKSKTLEVNVIPEGDIYRLITHSELESAKRFESWVYDEVLPTLRKTGSYSISKEDNAGDEKLKRAEAMLINAKTRMANTYLKLAEISTESSEYKNIIVAKAAQVLSGEELLPLPKQAKKTYSAKEIGDTLGISANKVGKLANANGLKVPQYGEMYRSKSEYSSKEVDTWRYYDTVIPALQELVGQGVA